MTFQRFDRLFAFLPATWRAMVFGLLPPGAQVACWKALADAVHAAEQAEGKS